MIVGGWTGASSFCTQDEMSKSMNSSAFSCGESMAAGYGPQRVGNGTAAKSPPPCATWTSLKIIRPHSFWANRRW